MQLTYVGMRLMYVNMHVIYVNMQYINVNIHWVFNQFFLFCSFGTYHEVISEFIHSGGCYIPTKMMKPKSSLKLIPGIQ